MANSIPRFLAGGGEMGALMRTRDWAGSPLGLPKRWPQGLQSAIRLMLQSGHPMFIFWGPSRLCFYNDAYRATMGAERHPHALGQPAQQVWREIWRALEPQIAQVMTGGEPTWHVNRHLRLMRNGRREDTFWTYSLGPLDGEDDGRPGGVLAICTETTHIVCAERRYRFLSNLSDRLRPVTDPQEVMAAAAEMLGRELGVACVGYSEVEPGGEYVIIERDWAVSGFPSVVGRHRLADYGPEMVAQLRAGRSVRVDDAGTDRLTAGPEAGAAFARIATRAFIDVPVIKHGCLSGILFVLGVHPRAWQDDQVRLVEEVAERTWAAVERARAEAALRQADRRKDEFLAMLAHELRNPLAPISSAAQLLKAGQLDPERVRRTSDIISRQVDHMTGLVNDLLDVSRVTRGLIVLDQHEHEVAAILADAIEQVRPLLQSRRHRFELRPAPETVLVRGDEKRLVQVFSNLLNNAAKYTPEGGAITLQVQAREEQVALTVADNGIGMPETLLPHVFDLFSQAERSSDRSQGGLGLGLALVKRLVELHGGSVAADSEGPGKGSCFTVQLPRVARKAAPAISGEPARARGKSLRLLVVDDNVDAAQMLAMFLEEQGHQVRVETDSLNALERARLESFDACMLDIGLPGMDGNELARHLRALPETSKALLVAITGYGQQYDRKSSIQSGFDHYFVKPADPGKLAALLANMG